jgi:uncharacterized tellurite resistance protein B-like protein
MLIESIIKKHLKTLVEAKEAKGSVAKSLDEFSVIHEQITKLKSELKRLEEDPKYKASKEKVSQILEELKATGQDAIETKKFVLKMTRAGSEAESVSYAKVLEEFLPKISIKLRETYSQLKSSYTTITKRSPSIEVKKKDVIESGSGGGSLSGVLSGIRTAHSIINRLKAKFS